jgi:spore maturation protein CgeB
MNKIIKAVIVLMQHDYGKKERGFSYEYYNVLLPFINVLGKENVLLFDFYSEFKAKGKQAMNKNLLDFIKAEKPDLTLFCLFENEFDEKTMNDLRSYTKTVAYFFDDPWRQSYVRHWIKYFDYFTSPDYYTFKQYELDGIKNAIYVPFGFNSKVYIKKDLPVKYDVSFVGGYSPLRRWLINLLLKHGIKVNVFGRNWGHGIQFVTQEEIVNIFNQSKINLNLSNGICHDFAYLLWSLSSLKAMKHNFTNKKNKEQVKGRHFEINACGGFQLSYFVPGLNSIYEIDKEIGVYDDTRNLPLLVKFFLCNDELRNQIAANGYLRSLKEHKSDFYIRKILNKVFDESD